MQRRNFLKGLSLLSVLSVSKITFGSVLKTSVQTRVYKRVRPGDAEWPSREKWNDLQKVLNGDLLKLESPLNACRLSPGSTNCKSVLSELQNPYYLGDTPSLTQTSGWLNAWKSAPSAYAVAARTAEDVAAAVNFAGKNNLRLVVKGGGHSYQGTSNAPDSLLIWTRHINQIDLHEQFVAEGAEGKESPQPAVTLGAGVIWMQAYNAVTTKGGRYVQGGGCATVGVAGLIQSGGFGSFSKKYGAAAAGLLEAEIVIADGSILTANKYNHPDLFKALKGGGGGSFGVVTKLTLRTRALPEFFGVAFGCVQAKNEEAYKKLLTYIISFYRDHLFNPHWGEQMIFSTDNSVRIRMMFEGMSKEEVNVLWQPFKKWIDADKENFEWTEPMNITAIPARHLWDTDFLRKYAPSFVVRDDRKGADKENIFWIGNKDEAGQFIHSFHSEWLPAALLSESQQTKLINALYDATRHWSVSLHFNKGLAGAPEEEISAAKDTAVNPAALGAFALAIIAGSGGPAYDGMPGITSDNRRAKEESLEINKAAKALTRIIPSYGSYVSESDYFRKDWQESFWGEHYKWLKEVKRRYDPDGLFFVHHGVGSEEWSNDGFERINS